MLAPVLLFGFKCLHSERVVLSRAIEPHLGSGMHLICTGRSGPLSGPRRTALAGCFAWPPQSHPTRLTEGGALADVAPTRLPPPREMTGHDLRVFEKF